MLCDLCFNEVNSCTAIQKAHLEILKNSGRLSAVSSLPNWICDECDGNLKDTKFQIKSEIELQQIKSEIQQFHDVDNSVSWPHVENEIVQIKVEETEIADDKNTMVLNSENLEEDANLCKACSKICYLKDLNEKCICNECSSLENGRRIMQKKPIVLVENFKKLGDSYICTICPEGKSLSYKLPTYVRTHIRVTHFGRRYECSECNVKYKSSATIRKHYKMVHGIEDNIEQLSSTFVQDSESENESDCISDTHFIPEDEPTSLNYAVSNVNKIMHTISEIPASNVANKIYKCKFCPDDQTFLDSNSMREHIELHILRYVCVECNESCVDADFLRDHYATFHNTYGPKQLKVIIVKNIAKNQDHCDNTEDYKEKAYAAIKNKIQFKRLLNEIKKDSGGSYVCTICNNGNTKYRATTAVRHHVRSHHFGYKHPCTVCQKMFNRRQEVRIHLRTIHGIFKDVSAALIPVTVTRKRAQSAAEFASEIR